MDILVERAGDSWAILECAVGIERISAWASGEGPGVTPSAYPRGETKTFINEAYRRNPEIENEVIKEPVFILGYGRSGTTILHEVLSQDPQFRSVKRWEAYFPVPSPEAATYHSDPRIAKDGIRQRFHGGTIRPVKSKALTVPVDARAHGRTAGEFGAELRFVPVNRGNVVGMLTLGADSAAPVLFLLVKKVEQDPDPSVLPTDSEMEAAARDGASMLPV